MQVDLYSSMWIHLYIYGTRVNNKILRRQFHKQNYISFCQMCAVCLERSFRTLSVFYSNYIFWQEKVSLKSNIKLFIWLFMNIKDLNFNTKIQMYMFVSVYICKLSITWNFTVGLCVNYYYSLLCNIDNMPYLEDYRCYTAFITWKKFSITMTSYI